MNEEEMMGLYHHLTTICSKKLIPLSSVDTGESSGQNHQGMMELGNHLDPKIDFSKSHQWGSSVRGRQCIYTVSNSASVLLAKPTREKWTFVAGKSGRAQLNQELIWDQWTSRAS